MNQLVMERAVRRSRSAPRAAARAPRPVQTSTAVPAQPHEWRTLLVVAAGVLAVLLVATWSFAQGWGRGPVVGPGEIAVDGGIVRVDGVVSAARPQHAMPGMGTDDDPVAAGHRRVSVDVTLMAGAGTMQFSADRFGLEVDGAATEHRTHRDVLPGDELPAGTRLSGTLLFDVPVAATTASLTYDGAGSTDVVLPAEAEQVQVPGADTTDAGPGDGPGDAHGDGHGTATPADPVRAGR